MSSESANSTTTENQPWTIKRLLDWTTDYFVRNNSDQARLNAEVLLSEALDCERIQLYTRFDQVPEPEPVAKFREWVKRHAKGEPVAYLVGYREFYSLRFAVDSNVLIPRPETEHVVVEAIGACKAIANRPIEIFDIGTGSGCIAISLAKHIEHSHITASDISKEALSVAEENARTLKVSHQIDFIESDLFASFGQNLRADVIVSNPPYVGRAEKGTVDPGVREFEPSIALFSGEKGVDVIKRLVVESVNWLNSSGFLIFETSPIIFDDCLEIVSTAHSFGSPRTVKDLAGHRRVIVVQLKS